MKRTAILTLTAFYLLLTSGMFVCAVHCSVETLMTKPSMQMACTKPCCKQSGACKKDDCGKKHGTFTIKENVKPGYRVHFTAPLLTLAPLLQTANTPNILTIVYSSSCANCKAPPGTSGKALTIQLHSLLI